MNPQELAAKVGEQIGTSEWAEMSQERINQFAEATGDHQFIHVNEEMAKMTKLQIITLSNNQLKIFDTAVYLSLPSLDFLYL